tara:strand:- start:5646 stop:6806 length:1161 start_codon:yes stop_codon:yes gene_type:complete
VRRGIGRALGLLGLYCGVSVLAYAGSGSAYAASIADAGLTNRASGYLITEFRLVTPGAGPEDCPDGFNEGYSQRFLATLSPTEREAHEQDPRLVQQALAPWYYDDPDQDPCANPAAFPDPGMHTIERPLAMPRMEPDGSMSERELPPARCPSPDVFAGQVEQRTIDNQYWRVMGCVRGYQPTGLAAAFADSAILDGSMTILLSVAERERSDDGAVDVGIYSSHQPVTVGTDGKPLPFASLSVAEEARYHNVARGQLRNGVLTTDYFDLRIIQAAQRLDSELYLRDARLRLEMDPGTGRASGYLAGYWDLASLAHAAIRIQDRTGRSSGKPAADAHGYTCPGKYYAVHRLADGHPDPDTGNCNSISVLYSVRAVPAFVLGAGMQAPL